MRFARTISLSLALALATSSVPVLADDTAAAEVLFKEGKALMDQGNYADACPKLEASLAYDRSAGGTLLRLAACYQGMKKWASAWGRYSDALTRAKQQNRPDRVEVATKGIAEVEPHMSRLTVRLDPKVRVVGLELKLDHVVAPEGAWNTAMPIDPGPHVLVASAPGHTTRQISFVISDSAEDKVVELQPLEVRDETPKTAPTTDPKGSGQTAAYVAFGTGVVLLGAGAGMYFKARAQRDQYFEDCRSQPVVSCDDPDGRSRVRTWETLAFLAGGAGLAAIGIGITVLVTSKPSGDSAAATPASRSARIVVAPTVAASGGGFSIIGEY